MALPHNRPRNKMGDLDDEAMEDLLQRLSLLVAVKKVATRVPSWDATKKQ
jgi:hypothetical protein